MPDLIKRPGIGMVAAMTHSPQRPPEPAPAPADELVREFLHGQNLEQIGRVDEAIPLYERALGAAFDAAGPYDRLIFIYQQRQDHRAVIRVAEASLRAVRTYDAKRMWYTQQLEAARKALGSPPQPLPR
ncbi:MAG: hypothetical protein NVSMB32_10970 [Actinomycetota bacterium]